MGKAVVVYQSKYGSTKQYAQWIADALKCDLRERGEATPQDLADYDVVIYGGGLYAGGVGGVDLLIKGADCLRDKGLILFTCGLADPQNPQNVAHIRASLQKVLPPPLYGALHLFHVRGGIDYGKLSTLHRAMMGMLRHALLKKDEGELTDEDRALLSTYGGKADFTDEARLVPLLACARQALSDRG